MYVVSCIFRLERARTNPHCHWLILQCVAVSRTSSYLRSTQFELIKNYMCEIQKRFCDELTDLGKPFER